MVNFVCLCFLIWYISIMLEVSLFPCAFKFLFVFALRKVKPILLIHSSEFSQMPRLWVATINIQTRSLTPPKLRCGVNLSPPGNHRSLSLYACFLQLPRSPMRFGWESGFKDFSKQWFTDVKLLSATFAINIARNWILSPNGFGHVKHRYLTIVWLSNHVICYYWWQ